MKKMPSHVIAIISVVVLAYVSKQYCILQGVGVKIFIITLIIIFLFFIAWCLYGIFSFWKLPGDSIYNPLGFIEIHIAGKGKGNKHKFFRLCVETILVAKKLQKDVMFFTYHDTEERLRQRFGSSIEITKPNILEKVINLTLAVIIHLIAAIRHSKCRVPFKLHHPYIKCYIDIQKLPESFEKKYTPKKKNI